MAKIPVITNQAHLLERLHHWQRGLKDVTRRVRTPEVPWNFVVASKQGGNSLSWARVDGADGYVVEWNATGDFETGFTAIAIRDADQLDYFDAVPTSGGTAPQKRYYRVYATAGTVLQPHGVRGNETQVISSTAIAPNDTATASTTAADTATDDAYQSRTRYGRYGFDTL